MAALKTKENNASVVAYLNSIGDKQQRADAKKLSSMMRAATGSKARMWGKEIVGFGSYHYTYQSGREGDWMLVGFSPRKKNLSVYIMAGLGRFEKLMARLGKYKTGKSCLYINQLDDVDEKTLNKLIVESVNHMRETYPTR